MTSDRHRYGIQMEVSYTEKPRKKTTGAGKTGISDGGAVVRVCTWRKVVAYVDAVYYVHYLQKIFCNRLLVADTVNNFCCCRRVCIAFAGAVRML